MKKRTFHERILAEWFWRAWPTPGAWEAYGYLCAYYPVYRTSAFGRPWQDTQ